MFKLLLSLLLTLSLCQVSFAQQWRAGTGVP